ncbi:MAG: hypothetical protein F4X56_04820 [Gammaproteobacteria bacterium]|nr:hypothetical protein [Gammaproteobacteria bacterium]
MLTECSKKSCFPCLGYVLIVLVICACSTGFVRAQEIGADLRSLLDGVLNAKETTKVRTLRNCAYTQQTTIKDVGSMQERFDPSAGLGLEWQLLRLNGKSPTEQQFHNYEPKPRQRHPAVLNFEFIDIDSIQLLDKSQSKLKFVYKVLPSVAQSLNQQVAHELTIDSNTGQLLEMKSIARKSFRIHRWTHVNEYENFSTFRFEEQTKGTVLEQVTFKLGVKSGRNTLYREVSKNFSDFDCTHASISEDTMNTDGDQINDELDSRVPLDETSNSHGPSIR